LQFLVGYLLDTIGPRRTMGGLMLSALLGALLFAASSSFHLSALAMALIGLGCSPLLMGSLYLFGRLWPPARFAVLAGLLIGLGNLGNVVAATPLAWSAATFGWRASMAGIGIAVGVAAFLLHRLVTDPPPAARAAGERASIVADLVAILRMRVLWATFPLHLLGYAMVATERGLWVGPYLRQVQEMAAIPAGNVILAMSLAMALGAMACGPADRLAEGPKVPALIACGVTALLLLAFAALGKPGLAMTVALFAGIGFFGLSYSLLLGHGRLFFPDHLLGRGVTTLNFFAIGGAGLVQAITGNAMERMLAGGMPQVEAYAWMHAGMGAALLAATAIFMFAPARPR
jgi:sugar phosphate permease